MLIGFMDRSKKPTKIAKTTALMSSYYGLELIYFRTSDVDMESGIVKGKMYKKNKWVSAKRKLPKIIDIASRCFIKETKEITSYLRKNAILTFDNKNKPNKKKLQEKLSEDKNLSYLVIPTQKLDTFETLENFLRDYPSIIIKPLFGKKGMGLYSLRKRKDYYILAHKKEQKLLNHTELFDFYKRSFLGEKYILQKLIESSTENGDPFDCRIVVQKDETGKWVIGKIFFRIGTGQKVVSNTSHGGSICEPEHFLKMNFGDQWEDIYQKLENVAMTLPYKIEEIKQTPTMDLGLDIGIDKKGDLFLFEANNGASLDLLISESAILRLGYYQYIYDKHPELKECTKKETIKVKKEKLQKQIERLKDQNRLLIQEKNHNQKKFEQMIFSRSWRFTSPIRKICSMFKKDTIY